MTEEDAIHYYVECAGSIARQLPIADAKAFLRGALTIAGEHDAVTPLRAAYSQLCEADDQLAFIAAGQMRLNLDCK